MNKPLLSIITPVYNCYHLMDRLLETLEKQTSDDFEVIFIDDCSKDDSYNLLSKELQNYHFKYKLLQNKKNEGPGNTRNHGISVSQGDYLTFVDSDDYISTDFVKNLEKKIKRNKYDVVIFDYLINKAGKISTKKSLPLNYGTVDSKLALALSNGMCWGKVFKKQVIIDNSIQFPELMRSEDLAFVKSAISKCNSIYYLPNKLYTYMIVSTSIMHRADTLNTNNNIKAYRYIEKNIDKGPELEMIYIREYLYLIVQILFLQKKNNNEIKKFIEKCEKEYPTWYKNKYIKYQPFYLKTLLFLIKNKCISLLKIIFLVK